MSTTIQVFFAGEDPETDTAEVYWQVSTGECVQWMGGRLKLDRVSVLLPGQSAGRAELLALKWLLFRSPHATALRKRLAAVPQVRDSALFQVSTGQCKKALQARPSRASGLYRYGFWAALRLGPLRCEVKKQHPEVTGQPVEHADAPGVFGDRIDVLETSELTMKVSIHALDRLQERFLSAKQTRFTAWKHLANAVCEEGLTQATLPPQVLQQKLHQYGGAKVPRVYACGRMRLLLTHESRRKPAWTLVTVFSLEASG